jgi:hypothetical protein
MEMRPLLVERKAWAVVQGRIVVSNSGMAMYTPRCCERGRMSGIGESKGSI